MEKLSPEILEQLERKVKLEIYLNHLINTKTSLEMDFTELGGVEIGADSLKAKIASAISEIESAIETLNNTVHEMDNAIYGTAEDIFG